MTTHTLDKPKVKYESTQLINRGEIWNAILPTVGGSVQNGERPFLIFSNDIGNRFSPIVFGIPITSKVKKDMPTHTKLKIEEGMDQDSIILGEQIITIPTSDLRTKICKVSDEKMFEIEFAHFISTGMMNRYNITRKK